MYLCVLIFRWNLRTLHVHILACLSHLSSLDHKSLVHVEAVLRKWQGNMLLLLVWKNSSTGNPRKVWIVIQLLMKNLCYCMAFKRQYNHHHFILLSAWLALGHDCLEEGNLCSNNRVKSFLSIIDHNIMFWQTMLFFWYCYRLKTMCNCNAKCWFNLLM